MQQSPYEIKEKLLQALDNEYNVVDMDAVLDVITALEKTIITKEALEKTRIGKYINELRKRTTNEQLARRAKDLVKSWRRLLPQTPQRVNGEETHSIISSPGGLTVVGPGPGPGIGPGPGPGNRSTFKACLFVPAIPRYKTSSPSMMVERSSSPYFSSASNSPLLISSVLQGSNIPTMPSNYAPLKLAASQADANSLNKTILNSSNQSKNMTSSQVFRPVSPSALKSDLVTSSGTCILPSRTCHSISPGLRNNSSSSSPSLNTSVNVCSQNVSPTSAFSVTHSTLDIAKTNAANKRLRKESAVSNCAATKELLVNDSKTRLGNGTSNVAENILPSESSAFNSVTVCNSNSVESDKTLLVSSLKTPKRKRSFDNKNELQENRLGDMLASLHSGSKLPKVKTTQQLIADLQAKKSNASLSPDTLTSVDTLHSSEAEVSRTKSELLKKFLIASQSARSESNQESPVDESSVSISDYGSHPVPDVSSVIKTNFDISSSISYPDPVDEEIKRILSDLPPINPDEIDLDAAASSLTQPTSVTNDDLNRLHEPWEFVNGVYDCNGAWKPWQECTEQKSYLGESFQILPYVNID